MVKLLVGKKGAGKTKQMIHLANECVDTKDGSIVFINKNHRLMYDLKHSIRVVSMQEYPHITNIDEYIGFIYGIMSSDHDLEVIFIDSILKHADVEIEHLEEFITRLTNISKLYGPDFVVSVSAELDELGDYVKLCEVLN